MRPLIFLSESPSTFTPVLTLRRASRGGPPASVLGVAPRAVVEDDARLARAFTALGAVLIH